MAEFIPYQFNVRLYEQQKGKYLCGGSFAEVSGLEASMEVKTIREGGRNWGEIQLSGQTSFSNVVIKRGITKVADLWSWFDICTRAANYQLRLNAEIDVLNPADTSQILLKWKLTRALPIKFKGPELSATADQVAIEELELVHEGLVLERP